MEFGATSKLSSTGNFSQSVKILESDMTKIYVTKTRTFHV